MVVALFPLGWVNGALRVGLRGELLPFQDAVQGLHLWFSLPHLHHSRLWPLIHHAW